MLFQLLASLDILPKCRDIWAHHNVASYTNKKNAVNFGHNIHFYEEELDIWALDATGSDSATTEQLYQSSMPMLRNR